MNPQNIVAILENLKPDIQDPGLSHLVLMMQNSLTDYGKRKFKHQEPTRKIKNLVKSGEYIMAIKVYRETFWCHLKEAKDAIDAYRDKLIRKQNPCTAKMLNKSEDLEKDLQNGECHGEEKEK